MTAWRYALEHGGETFDLAEGVVVMGRSESSDVTIAEASVSRRHAELTVADGNVVIRDLGSSNGTWLNGRRVEEPENLVPGDLIELGEAEIRFRASPPAVGASATADPMATVRMRIDGEAVAGEAPSNMPHQGFPRQPGPATYELQRSSVELARRTLGEEGEEGDVEATRAAPPQPTVPQPTVSQPSAQQSPGPRPSGQQSPGLRPPDPQPSPPQPPPPPPPPAFAPASEPSAGAARPATGPAPRPGTGVAVAAAAAEPASLGRRFLALLLDDLWILLGMGLIYWLGGALGVGDAGLLLASMLPLLGVVIGWARWGVTPGKRIMGIVVTTLEGAPGIGMGRALLRFLGYLLGALPMGLGFLLAVFHPERRALHDLMAGSLVVDGRGVRGR